MMAIIILPTVCFVLRRRVVAYFWLGAKTGRQEVVIHKNEELDGNYRRVGQRSHFQKEATMKGGISFPSIIPGSMSRGVHFHIYATCVWQLASLEPRKIQTTRHAPLLWIGFISTIQTCASGKQSMTLVDDGQEENMELKRHKTDRCEDYEWTDYMSLPFTQYVISETLRLANIVNAIWRKATKDVEIKGYLIPKGNSVVASLMSVHTDGTMYEKPFEFNPWRWEGIEGSGNGKYGFSPFGGGQRLCPGLEVSRLELSIFLHHLVTTYTWRAHPDHILYFPTVKMSRKLPITVKPL